MSDIARLLDSYRLAILHNADAFAVLSLLFRNGSADLDEISAHIEGPKFKTAGMLRDLYQGGWVRVGPHERWYIANRSESLLDGIGIHEDAIDSLMRELIKDDARLARTQKMIRLFKSFNHKNDCRHALQINYWMARDESLSREITERATEASIYLLLQFHGADLKLLQNSSNIDLFVCTSSDSDHVRGFFGECKVPSDPVTAIVSDLLFYQIILFTVSFGMKHSYLDPFLKNTPYLESLWSEAQKREPHLTDRFWFTYKHLNPIELEKRPHDSKTAIDWLKAALLAMKEKLRAENPTDAILTAPKQLVNETKLR